MPKFLKAFFNIVVLAIVVGTPLFYIKEGIYPYVLAKTPFFQGFVELFVACWIAVAILYPEYRPRRNLIFYGMMGFCGTLFLTSALGIDPGRSLWSTQERAMGAVTFLHAALFAVALASLHRVIAWRWLWRVSIGTAALVSVLGFLQLHVTNLLLEEVVRGRPGSTFGNPTFLAGYLSFNIFLGIFIFLDTLRTIAGDSFVRNVERWYAVGATAISLLGLLGAQTRGDILGLGMGLMVLLTMFAFRPPQTPYPIFRSKRFYGIIIGFLLLLGASFWMTRTASVWSNVPGLSRFQDISFSNEGLQPRFIALRAAWKGFLEKPVLGWGWENFNIVFNKHYDPKLLEINYQETRFDKPHNMFLEYLVTGGVMLLLGFIALAVCAIIEALRLEDKLFGSVAVAAIAAYLARSAFMFDTIGPFLMLYLLLGAIAGMRVSAASLPTASQKHRPAKRTSLQGPEKMFIAAACGIAVIVAYFVNVRTLEASYHQFWGYKHFVASRHAKALESFKTAISIWSPYGMNLKRDYASAVAEAYFYNHDAVPKEEVLRAVRAMEEVAKEHPHDAYNHYAMIDLYNQVWDIDPEYFLPAAEREAKRALELSPDRQEIYFSLAKTRSLAMDYPGSLAVLKHAIDLNPKVPDAHFYYGLVLFADDQLEAGYREIHIAISLGRQWKNYLEPRVVANFFANGGHLDEAIELYKESIRLNDDDVESRLKLGIAYFYAGKRDLAKETLQEAMKKFDVTKSVSYESIRPILQELGLQP